MYTHVRYMAIPPGADKVMSVAISSLAPSGLAGLFSGTRD